jgi:hypothetical protein
MNESTVFTTIAALFKISNDSLHAHIVDDLPLHIVNRQILIACRCRRRCKVGFAKFGRGWEIGAEFLQIDRAICVYIAQVDVCRVTRQRR